jgi:FkbM family methyltransferase
MKHLIKKLVPALVPHLRRVIFSASVALAWIRHRLGLPLHFRGADRLIFECADVATWAKMRRRGDALGDPELAQYVHAVLRPGDIVVDVGAAIGGLSLLCAQIVGPGGKVYAFEAEEQNFHQLEINIALNRLSEYVIPMRRAVFSSNGHVILNTFDPSKAEGLHSLGRASVGGFAPQFTQWVQSLTLDSFCGENAIEHIDLLKIDVEGAEADVLEGAADLLRRQAIRRIVFEVCQIPLAGMGHMVDDLVNPLRDAGYRIYRLRPNTLIPVSREEIVELDWANLLALPHTLGA